MIWLLWPTLLWAFSSGPSRQCREDAYCVLVQETHCGEIGAVALGEDKAWADFEAKEKVKALAAGRVCDGRRPSHRDYEARCVAGECVAVSKKK